eukprot:Gb_23325 [translate_table: standard]
MSTPKMLVDEAVKVLQHNLFTNDVFYTEIAFDMSNLRPDLLPLLPLFCQSLLGDQFVVSPTINYVESKFDLLLASMTDTILLIESYSDFLTEELLLQAVDIRQGAAKAICKEVEIFVNQFGKNKMNEPIRLPLPKFYEQVEELVEDGLIKTLQFQSKMPQTKTISSLGRRVLTVLTEDGHMKEDGIIRSNDAVEEDGVDGCRWSVLGSGSPKNRLRLVHSKDRSIHHSSILCVTKLWLFDTPTNPIHLVRCHITVNHPQPYCHQSRSLGHGPVSLEDTSSTMQAIQPCMELPELTLPWKF